AITDLVALIEGLAETRGRNGKPFARMVKKAASYKANEALKLKIINGIINTKEELLKNTHNKTVHLKGRKITMNIQNSQIVDFKMDLGQKLLNIFAHPNMAYILLLIGAALIYLELQAPGGFLAGSVGVFSLMLAGIGFQILPLNFGALCLIILSFALFILEIYITSYGILSLFGLGALITGSLFLYRTDNAYLQLSTKLVISTVSAVTLFLALVLCFVLKDRKKGKRKALNSLVGRTAVVVEVLKNGEYMIKVSGELWKASSDKKLTKGDKCLIKDEDRDQMILKF
ncbi:MAG: hypothetical protein OXB84_02990, partial [Halobacteriovoraceae bacterium]|nr:hypothetical protein [Halobacteriovoraceae bacterium]